MCPEQTVREVSGHNNDARQGVVSRGLAVELRVASCARWRENTRYTTNAASSAAARSIASETVATFVAVASADNDVARPVVWKEMREATEARMNIAHQAVTNQGTSTSATIEPSPRVGSLPRQMSFAIAFGRT
jgi:hypothetical protein